MTPAMYEIISRKRDGRALTPEEIRTAILGYVDGSVPDHQMAALLMAIYLRGLDARELNDLTGTMSDSGTRIELGDIPGAKIDKHSTGGVGDKTSLVVGPLVAACGVKVPMVSGRALGHTGGTLDKLESIPGMEVNHPPEGVKAMLEEVGLVICSQSERFVPADRKLYALRDATATVGSLPLIASSIMSKKLAVETDGIVLDVKTGRGAFMKKREEAVELCQTMVEIGAKAGRATVGLITDMNQPLGRAVGNALEVREALDTLAGRGPEDLLEVSFALGACMLELAGACRDRDHAGRRLEEALRSGEALRVFQRFIAAQGGDPRVCHDLDLLPTAPVEMTVPAPAGGFVAGIDALEIGLAAVELGAGRTGAGKIIDPGAGFRFHKKVGDPVEAGEALATLHAADAGRASRARSRVEKAVEVCDLPTAPPQRILLHVSARGVVPWP